MVPPKIGGRIPIWLRLSMPGSSRERTPTMRRLLLALTLAAGPALGAMPEPAVEPAFVVIKARVDAGRFDEALADLDRLAAERGETKEVLTFYGYAHRKAGRAAVARGFYDRALANDADYPEALEYLGELELSLGRIEAARALLARLMAACPVGCTPLDDLREAVAAAGG
jgi:Flp pilus assembly protein TadD